MKTVNIKVIYEIYITQGLDNTFEFLNRIEYKPTDKYSSYLMKYRRNINTIEEYLKKITEK